MNSEYPKADVERVKKSKTEQKAELQREGLLLAQSLKERAYSIENIYGANIPLALELFRAGRLVKELAESIVVPGTQPARTLTGTMKGGD
jgi:hypothetical protein